jgi:SNF family Na+-dependent transporter
MKNSNLVLTSFLNSLGITIYISGVSLLMIYGEQIFGKMDNFLGPVAFLLLFVVSAAITGALAVGKPVILYLNKQKKEAVKLFFYTIGWLALLTLIALIIQILFNR